MAANERTAATCVGGRGFNQAPEQDFGGPGNEPLLRVPPARYTQAAAGSSDLRVRGRHAAYSLAPLRAIRFTGACAEGLAAEGSLMCGMRRSRCSTTRKKVSIDLASRPAVRLSCRRRISSKLRSSRAVPVADRLISVRLR